MHPTDEKTIETFFPSVNFADAHISVAERGHAAEAVDIYSLH